MLTDARAAGEADLLQSGARPPNGSGAPSLRRWL